MNSYVVFWDSESGTTWSIEASDCDSGSAVVDDDVSISLDQIAVLAR